MQPTSPNPQYDFILKDKPPRPKINLLASLTPGLRRTLIAAVGLGITIALAVLLFGNKGGAPQELLAAASRAHEISRVSALVTEAATDTETQSLSATAASVLSSQEVQLNMYLSRSNHKPSSKILAQYYDPKMDEKVQASAESNTLEATFVAYLKPALSEYKSSLYSATAANPEAKTVLQPLLESVNNVLSAPSLKP